MKLVIRIFNFIIMALSAAAIFFLFQPPAFSFNSNIGVDVKAFSKFVPETDFTEGLDIVSMLGTDSIHLSIKFSLNATDLHEVMDGDRNKINDKVISNNVDDIVDELHEPVDLITDFTIRAIIKKLITAQITTYVDQAVQKYGGTSTAEEIMDEVGMDDAYFTNFSYNLYDAANADGATVDSTTDVLFAQIDDALAKAEDSGAVDTSGFSNDVKANIKDTLVNTLTDLKLVKEDNSLRKISQISYIYLGDYIRGTLENKLDDTSVLAQGADETDPEYADRMINLFVLTQLPDMFYKLVGYISLGLFIGLFVFAGVWGLLIILTLIKTFTKKPWTIFGFWFWIVGAIQLIMGVGITVFGKFILPTFNVSQYGLPLSSVILAPRTYALMSSLFFAGALVLAIVYRILKEACVNQIEKEKMQEKAK